MLELDLKDKVAFISGAARGQGYATALRLAKEGVHIAALDLGEPITYPAYAKDYGAKSGEKLDSLKQACEAEGVRCELFTADIRDVKAVDMAVGEAHRKLGTLDIVFNNAGICGYGEMDTLKEEAFDAMIAINLKGPWLLARAVVPIMKSQKSGVIINNVSVASHRGMNRLSHYAASKWGLLGLTKSWAIELAPFGIRVVSIHPTGVNTSMNDGLAAMEGATAKEIAERSAGNLLPVPWIEPEDVAEAVVYLASNKARFMTGSELVIDAGLLTR